MCGEAEAVGNGEIHYGDMNNAGGSGPRVEPRQAFARWPSRM
jgi:hypothetical protein